MAQLAGRWEERGNGEGKYPKSVQTTFGGYFYCLIKYCRYHKLSTPKALRKLWAQAFKSDIDICPIPLEHDSPIITVPVSEEMFDRIEWFRRSYPRNAVLRSMTVAILKKEGFTE